MRRAILLLAVLALVPASCTGSWRGIMTASARRPSTVLAVLLAAVVVAASACGGDGRGTAPTLAITGSPEPASDVPVARGYHVLLSLDEGRGVLLYGGQPGDWGQGEVFQDTWTYTPSTGWVELTPEGQLPMYGVAAAYVAAADRVVVAAFLNLDWAPVKETWIYDLSANRWNTSGAGEHPGGLEPARATYDLESDRVILINRLGETWAYDYNTDTWMEMAPKVSPPDRESAQMAYHVDADRVILFGGFAISGETWTGGLADTWAYDYNTDTWTELTPDVSPPARSRGAMAYDPVSGRMILFGGVTWPADEPLDDTWAYDYETNTWTELSPAEAPSARGFHAMAYNPADGTIVLFGGGEARWRFENDTWIYDPAKNTWAPAP